ncbi:MAG TPA: RecX family transcriptional regulator [Acetobacteraceae bacterium]|jgi:regulatory protein
MGTRNRSDHASDPPPDSAALRDAALAYLARYAATEAGLRRVLERRIDRWARDADGDRDVVTSQAAEAKRAAAGVVTGLATAGAVSNAAFAESRARNLARSGRSRRAIAASLIAKGVDTETMHRVLPSDDAETEFVSALALARRRRIGPFRAGGVPDADGRRRELAVLARAGFPQDVARRALETPADEATDLVERLRR